MTKEYLKDNTELMKEYDYEKNKELDLNILTLGSHRKIWWLCSKGHSYEAFAYIRKKGHGCPYCASQKPIIGQNDLATERPDLVKEWDYNENDKLGITPNNIKSKSGKKVSWVCNKGHKWKATVANRSKGNSCPICSKKRDNVL